MVVMMLVAALVLAACGTRLTDKEFVELSQEGSTASVVDDGASTGGDGAGTTDTATDVTAPGATDGGTTGGTTSAGTTGGSSGGTTGGTTGGSTGSSGGPNQASDVGITANQIVIGTIVAENGVLGDAFAPAARGHIPPDRREASTP